MTIKSTFKKIGLNEKEINVYLAVLKYGKIKPSDLAKVTKLNRATVYNIAQNLVSRGIIAEDLSGKILYFSPLSPENLIKILDQPKRELEEKKNLIEEAVNELKLINSEQIYPVPKIRFIEEKDLEKFLFDNIVKWQKSVIETDGIWWGFQDHSFVESFPGWVSETWKTKESKDEKFKKPQVFTNDSKIERGLKDRHYPKRQVRFLDDINFTATEWVCGNCLVTISTRSKPFYAIEIHDELLAQNMRAVFEKLWSAVE